MQNISTNNKRIAKNTLLLYVRMLLLMAITLYTSRVVLSTLGVQDYGIYNVIGGLVAMFSVLSNSLSSSISRFITFALGKGDVSQLKVVFSSAVTVQIALSTLIAIVAEIAGVWFLNAKMNIPVERMDAANWVLQFSILTFVINLISVPYNAAIIAHERMSAFAYISILEAVGRLTIAYFISLSPIDKLTFYAILMCLVALIIRVVYGYYCNQHFEECHYQFVYNRQVLKQIFNFAGWNFMGTGAYMLNTQGVNLLMNMYFGVTVNAARGIATQVEGALRQFINSFTTAVNPQITKSYATGELSYMYSLVCRSAKFSSFLLTFFAVPIILEAPFIFSIWLDNVPEYAVIFFRLSVLVAYVDGALANSLMTSVFATGNIKAYQITVSCLGILVFPISWLFYHCLLPVWTTYLVYFAVYCMVLGARLYMVRKAIGMTIKTYIKSVLYKVIPISLLAFLMPSFLLQIMEEGFLRLCCVVILSMISTAGLIMLWGLTKGERTFLTDKIRGMFNKFN